MGKPARISLCECRRGMEAIDKEAMCKGVVPRSIMSQVQTNTCYYKGQITILAVVPANTPTGQPRIVARLMIFMQKKRGA